MRWRNVEFLIYIFSKNYGRKSLNMFLPLEDLL